MQEKKNCDKKLIELGEQEIRVEKEKMDICCFKLVFRSLPIEACQEIKSEIM